MYSILSQQKTVKKKKKGRQFITETELPTNRADMVNSLEVPTSLQNQKLRRTMDQEISLADLEWLVQRERLYFKF